MEEYDKNIHGNYRKYQKAKIKESSDRIQADKQKKYDTKAKAKSTAADKNKKAKKSIKFTKELKKEIKKDKSSSKESKNEGKKILNKAKKIYKKSKTTKNKELYSSRYKEAKLRYDVNLENGKNRVGIAKDGVDSQIDTSDPTGIMFSQTPIAFKSAFSSKNPITKLYSK